MKQEGRNTPPKLEGVPGPPDRQDLETRRRTSCTHYIINWIKKKVETHLEKWSLIKRVQQPQTNESRRLNEEDTDSRKNGHGHGPQDPFTKDLTIFCNSKPFNTMDSKPFNTIHVSRGRFHTRLQNSTKLRKFSVKIRKTLQIFVWIKPRL